MKGNEPRYSRVNRKKMRNRSNRLLNIMIGLVVLLILIVGTSIIVGNNDDGKEKVSDKQEVEETGSSDNESQSEEDNSVSSEEGDESASSGSEENRDDGQSSDGSGDSGKTDNNDEEAADDEKPGTVTIVPDNDEVIKETVIDPGWRPIGTVQTGEHESKYDVNHVDWDEKKKAIAYASGHSEGELIFWKIKNGGGPQKSIGIVSTRDKSKKYRVYLEWIDEKGWQPVQMDILNTLDFEY